MKITDVTAYTLQAKVDEWFGNSLSGGTLRYATLVRVDTDEGITGYGEAGVGRETAAAQALVESYKPLLVGKDPFLVEKIGQEINHTLLAGLNRGVPVRALSGIDMALWDIIGKAFRVPVYTFWGGAVRTQVPVYATGLYYGPFEKVEDQCRARAEEAAAYVRSGFKAMKMKIGGLSLRDDLKNIEAVRKAIADAGPGGGYILAPDHSHPEISVQRLRWMKEAVDEYGQYPLPV